MPRTPKGRFLATFAAACFIAVVAMTAKALFARTAMQVQDEQPGGLVTKPISPIAGPERMAASRARPMSTLLRTANLQRMVVSAVGRRVFVSGQADVYDCVPGSHYVWLLRVYMDDRQKTLLREFHYRNHAVAVPEGEVTINPVFDDMIELPPGPYKFELILYAAGPGFKTEDTQFGENISKKVPIHVSRIQKLLVID